jgi:hypothetical protein
MKILSLEYRLIKNKAIASEKPLMANITRELALELLSRADNCPPINWEVSTEMAFAYLSKTFDPSTDYIMVFEDTDELGSGVQRLAGIVLSGLPSVKMYFMVEATSQTADSIARFKSHHNVEHLKITPEEAKQLMGYGPNTAASYYGPKKPKYHIKEMNSKKRKG